MCPARGVQLDYGAFNFKVQEALLPTAFIWTMCELQEALLGERSKLSEALQREEAHAATVAAASGVDPAIYPDVDPVKSPGAGSAAHTDIGPLPSGVDRAAGAMAVDGAVAEGATEQRDGAAGGGAQQAADADADALDAYMSSVRTQIEQDKARPGLTPQT